MAIALDATAATATAFQSVVTVASFTATAGALIRVDVCAGTDTDCTGVTYAGNALTELFDADLAAATTCRVASYLGITGADGSPHDVVATWAASISGAQCVRVSSWTGVDITSVAASHRTVYSAGDATGSGADVTVVDSQANDVVVSATMSFDLTIVAGQTSVGANNNIAGDGKSFGVQYTTAVGASTVMSWTNDTFNTHVAYALVPVSAPSVPGPTLHVIRSGIRLR